MSHISFDDANAMFTQSIVEYGGNLVYVRAAEPSHEHGSILTCRDIQTGRNLRIENPDPEEILCPSGKFRLGNVQHGGRVHYLSRSPRRQYRVGWTDNNVNNMSVEAFAGLGASFVNNMMNIFMSYKTALDKSREHGGCFAFDRQFAVDDRARVLKYKGTGVATIDAVTGMPNLKQHGVEHLESLFHMASTKE